LGANARPIGVVLLAATQGTVGSVDGQLRQELREDLGSPLHSRQGERQSRGGQTVGIEEPGAIFDPKPFGGDVPLAQPGEQTLRPPLARPGASDVRIFWLTCARWIDSASGRTRVLRE